MSHQANLAFNSEIAVVGIVKDIEETLRKDLARIESALASFKSVKWFLVESNSSDNSVDLMRNISKEKPNFNFISIEDPRDVSSRIPGMTKARNRYLEELRTNGYFKDCKLIVVADLNNLNNLIDENSILSCFVREDWDVCCANQKGRYYDIWALRHPLWSPNDCWQQHEFLRRYMRNPEKALFASIHSRMIRIPQSSEWIEVDSAFGGFAIYKREAILNANYKAFDLNNKIVCEHVSLHSDITNNGGKIYINPKLINTRTTDHSFNANMSMRTARVLLYPIKILKKLALEWRNKT